MKDRRTLKGKDWIVSSNIKNCGRDCPWCDHGLDGEMRINIIPTSQHGHLRTRVEEDSWVTLGPCKNLFKMLSSECLCLFSILAKVERYLPRKKCFKTFDICSGEMWSLRPHLPKHINLFCWQMQLRTVFVNNACRQLIQRWVTLCKSSPLYQLK